MTARPENLVSSTPQTFVIAAASSLMFFGLAVLGWGGLGALFSHPALIVLAIIGLALTAVAFFSRGNLSRGEREDRDNRWVLAVVALIALLILS